MKQSTRELIDFIQQKFGSISRFCQVACLDIHKVRPALYRDFPAAKQTRKEIKKLAEKCDNKPLGHELTGQQAEKLRVALATQYRFASHFYQLHPQFTATFVSNVVNKKMKTKCDRLKEMAQILNVNIDDEDKKGKK